MNMDNMTSNNERKEKKNIKIGEIGLGKMG